MLCVVRKYKQTGRSVNGTGKDAALGHIDGSSAPLSHGLGLVYNAPLWCSD